jgi:hypothetical protein
MVLICFDSSPYVSHSYPDEISPYVERLNPHAPLGWHWNARKPWGFNPHLFGSLTFTNNWCRYIIYIQCNIYIYMHIYLYYIIYHIVSIYTYILYMCVCCNLFQMSNQNPSVRAWGRRSAHPRSMWTSWKSPGHFSDHWGPHISKLPSGYD